ncbi:MAG TPA: LacI family transcriptional regulator, partial [Spirochaetaceae bacterium]|nr:LacI family transcriptional regulator [Spirochaetaceae bacterium]
MSIGKKLILAVIALTLVAGTAFAQKTYHIGVTLYDRDQFISSLEQAILEAAKKYPNVVVDSQDAKQDVNQQMAQVDVFATKKYDAVIVNLINTDT